MLVQFFLKGRFFMKVGKLDWNELKLLVENNRSVNREDVRVKSGIGEDCSVISFGNLECVVSTDPITGADKNIGKLAVHVNCNDIAAWSRTCWTFSNNFSTRKCYNGTNI